MLGAAAPHRAGAPDEAVTEPHKAYNLTASLPRFPGRSGAAGGWGSGTASLGEEDTEAPRATDRMVSEGRAVDPRPALLPADSGGASRPQLLRGPGFWV